MPAQNIIKLNISRHQKAVMSPKKGTRPGQTHATLPCAESTYSHTNGFEVSLPF